MATCPPKLTLESQACAGGVCFDENTCICNDPLVNIGVGDFVYGSPSCSLNANVVTGMWSTLAAVYWLLAIFVAVFLYKKTVVSPPTTKPSSSSPLLGSRARKWNKRNLPPLVTGKRIFFFPLEWSTNNNQSPPTTNTQLLSRHVCLDTKRRVGSGLLASRVGPASSHHRSRYRDDGSVLARD